MTGKSHKTWRTVHRWCGLALATFLIFYCLTGILLNHRRSFNYFITETTSVNRVSQTDPTPMQEVLDLYKNQINRHDTPRVIRLPGNGRIEFLYGSHGKITYSIDPETGIMEKTEKNALQPFRYLNNFHKIIGTGYYWLLISDLVCLATIVLTVSGLVVMQYRRSDFLLIGCGIILLLLGAILP